MFLQYYSVVMIAFFSREIVTFRALPAINYSHNPSLPFKQGVRGSNPRWVTKEKTYAIQRIA